MGCVYTDALPAEVSGTRPGTVPEGTSTRLNACEKLTKQSVSKEYRESGGAFESQLIHNRAFQSRRVERQLLAVPCPPGQWRMDEFAAALPVSGFSVTTHTSSDLRYLQCGFASPADWRGQ